MRKSFSLMLLLSFAALLLFGCAVDTQGDEAFGEQSQAFCASRPSGSLGDNTYPFGGYITGIQPDPAANWKLLNTYTRANGTSVVGRIDFGGPNPAQARITGNGLLVSSPMRITGLYVPGALSATPNNVRVNIYGDDWNGNFVQDYVIFDKRFGAPAGYHWGQTKWFGVGLTHIKGVGNQRIEFTYDNGDGTAGTTYLDFTGSLLEQCNIP